MNEFRDSNESDNLDLANEDVDIDLNDASWDILANCLQEFSDAWQKSMDTTPVVEDAGSPTLKITKLRPNEPPELKPFQPDSNEALRAVALVELIKLDMEFRSQKSELWKTLEQYREAFPEICVDGQLPADLVYEEFQLQKGMSAGASLEDYKKRFPSEFGSLSRLIDDNSSGSSSVFKPGATIAFDVGDRVDDFDLLTRLGKGAFATVFLARQNSMQRLVALKISADQGHEPQMLAQLDHPHIVRVYDQRVIVDPPARLMYMQHIAGGTLQEAFREAREIADYSNLDGSHLVTAIDRLLDMRGEALPVKSDNRRRLVRSTWEQVVSQIGNEIAQALAYAHQRNVLHRDLKPANVLLDNDCHVKLVDFNISFCSKLDGVMPAAYFGGSMAYMSPEQLEACSPDHDRTPDQLDGRSDLFSVGVMLFELLVGCRPFEDDMQPGDWSTTLEKMIDHRRKGIPESAKKKLEPWSRILGNTIIRCLEGDRVNRFADGEALQRNLEWAGNPNSKTLFKPVKHPVTGFANRTPYWTIGVLTIGISVAAVVFIATYNLDKSVPAGAGGTANEHGLFQKIMLYGNAFWFSLGAFSDFSFFQADFPMSGERTERKAVVSNDDRSSDGTKPENWSLHGRDELYRMDPWRFGVSGRVLDVWFRNDDANEF